MDKMSKGEMPTSFGVFSPRGHIMIAFESNAVAQKARQTLIDGGVSADRITYYGSAEALSQIEGSRETDNKIFQLGQEEEKVKRYTELAKNGAGFVVVYAPSDDETKQVMDLIHPLKPKFAEKYNLLTLEELA